MEGKNGAVRYPVVVMLCFSVNRASMFHANGAVLLQVIVQIRP